jgi:hypothetical protein
MHHTLRLAGMPSLRRQRVARGLFQLVVWVLLAGAGGGCARPRAETRRLPAWIFESSRNDRSVTSRPKFVPAAGMRGQSEASDFVVTALQDTGLRFGTDGTIASLWGYLHTSHDAVRPRMVETGDVLLFQTHVPVEDGCRAPDHAGIVSTVDRDGRITFYEARDGRVRRSYVDPSRPRLRRDRSGRLLNTFLRPKQIGDPVEDPIFAGEMLCAAIHPHLR